MCVFYRPELKKLKKRCFWGVLGYNFELEYVYTKTTVSFYILNISWKFQVDPSCRSHVNDDQSSKNTKKQQFWGVLSYNFSSKNAFVKYELQRVDFNTLEVSWKFQVNPSQRSDAN